MHKLVFETTSIGTRVLTWPGEKPWELGSIIKNKKERWKATHKARKITTYHATLDLAKAWLVTLESTGVDTTQLVPTPDPAAADVVDLGKDDVGQPSVDPTTGDTYIPMPGGGVQVIPAPQPLAVWRTWFDAQEASAALVERALATGLAAQGHVVEVAAWVVVEEEPQHHRSYQVDLVTTTGQIPHLMSLLKTQTSHPHPAYLVLPVLEAPTSYAAWLRRHSAGFAPDAVPME